MNTEIVSLQRELKILLSELQYELDRQAETHTYEDGEEALYPIGIGAYTSELAWERGRAEGIVQGRSQILCHVLDRLQNMNATGPAEYVI